MGAYTRLRAFLGPVADDGPLTWREVPALVRSRRDDLLLHWYLPELLALTANERLLAHIFGIRKLDAFDGLRGASRASGCGPYRRVRCLIDLRDVRRRWKAVGGSRSVSAAQMLSEAAVLSRWGFTHAATVRAQEADTVPPASAVWL